VKIEKGKNVRTLYAKELKIVEKIFKKLQNPSVLAALSMSPVKKLNLKSNLTKKGFMSRVEEARKYIREGEIIQTVLSQRFSVDFSGIRLMSTGI
jgi:anthranilate synthase component 1